MAFSYFDEQQTQQGNQNTPNSTNTQNQGQSTSQQYPGLNQSPNNTGDSTQQSLGSASPITTGQTTGSGASSSEKGNQFSNLQAYLDANKNSDFAGQVAGRVQGTIDRAGSSQNTADTNFRNAVNQNTVNENQDIVGRASSDPTKVTGNADDYSQWQKMFNANYGGPSNLSDMNSDYQKAYSDSSNARNTANQVQTEGGRDAYLQQEYGSGAGRYDYTPGLQNLDNLLIQSDPSAAQRFSGLKVSGNQAYQNFEDQQKSQNQYANDAANTTAKTRADSRSAVGVDNNGNLLENSQINQIRSAAQKQADQYNQQAQDQYKQYSQDFSNRNLNPQELAMTGLKQGQSLYSPNGRLDLGSNAYLQQGPQANLNTAATQDQQARVAALSQLAGLQNTYLPNASEAGSYNPSKAVTYNSGQLGTDLNSNQKAYQDALNQKTFSIPNNQFNESGAPLGGNTWLTSRDAINAFANGANPANRFDDMKYQQTQYQAALAQLQSQQKAYGLEDTVNGGTPAGDWSTFPSYDPVTGLRTN